MFFSISILVTERCEKHESMTTLTGRKRAVFSIAPDRALVTSTNTLPVNDSPSKPSELSVRVNWQETNKTKTPTELVGVLFWLPLTDSN